MFHIGPYHFAGHTLLAPMAGVTDRPFRQLCRRMGASMVVGEMLTSDPRLWSSRKSQLRMNHHGEPGPISVQIAGGDAQMLAEAARLNVARGADIIDINMGCPAKKVCNKAAGSALLRDEALVAEILDAVVQAVRVPVTLKIRTGWSPEQRNGVRIARLAQEAGIQALAVHGRTRACRFGGQAEYDTIADIRQAVSIPVFANGDITTAHKAAEVLRHTGADAVMIGRGAQGNPWIFRAIEHYLTQGADCAPPCAAEQAECLGTHLQALHEFYGAEQGVRVARKHVGWYCATLPGGEAFRRQFNQLDTAQAQLSAVAGFFATQA